MTPSILILAAKTPVGRERVRVLVDRWSTRLDVVRRDSTLIVLASSSMPRSTPASNLILFGELYGEAPRLGEETGVDVLRALTCKTWGSFLAIASGPDGCLAMVDPSGAGRAHLAADDDLALVSDALTPALMRDAGLPVTVDTAALAGCLVDPGTIVSAPLLRGVLPMTAGVAYDIAGRRDPQPIWSPSIGNTRAEDAGRALRAAVDLATRGILRGRRPLIELSGGLDSSVVVGTMAHLGMSPRAVNVELIGGDVDEIRYARATAERCGIDLRTAKVADYPDVSTIMDAEQVAYPYIYGVDAAFSDAVGAALDDEVDCVVTGQGGDAVFYQPVTPYTTIDRCRALGCTMAFIGPPLPSVHAARHRAGTFPCTGGVSAVQACRDIQSSPEPTGFALPTSPASPGRRTGEVRSGRLPETGERRSRPPSSPARG